MKPGFSHFRVIAPLSLILLVLLSGCDRSRLNDRMNKIAQKTGRDVSTVMGKISTTRRNYDYLEKTGGLLIEDPVVRSDETIFLPVYANIRGASNRIGPPDKQRKNAVIKEIVLEIDDYEPTRLYIYVETAMEHIYAKSPLVQGINLGRLAPGDYTVEYKNRNKSLVPLSAFRVSQ